MTSVSDINTSDIPATPRIDDAGAPPPWLLPVYFCVTLLPLSITLIGLRLTPLRILLLVLFIPFLIRVMRGAAGRMTSIDILMLAHAMWITLALIVVHGTQRIPFAGITMVELVGGYFFGRVLIRNTTDFARMIRIMVWCMLFLFPFAMVELFTGKLVIPDLIDMVFDSIERGQSAVGRMGLERVYAVFEHPILFGMFCSVAFANLYYLGKDGGLLRWVGLVLVCVLTFSALSSAPLLACALQGMMLMWDKITRGSWKTFIALGIIGYVTVDLLSNRTPITILIDKLTFDAATGWTRIAIFEFGIQNAIEHPIFGIGFNDWERPYWLTGSVDNFWLLNTMRFGFVGAFFLVAAFVVHLISVLRATIADDLARKQRVGYTIALAATCFTMLTVHVWGAVGTFVMFYLGAGSWFYTADHSAKPLDPDGLTKKPTKTPPKKNQFTRFPAQTPPLDKAKVTPKRDQAINIYARPAKRETPNGQDRLPRSVLKSE